MLFTNATYAKSFDKEFSSLIRSSNKLVIATGYIGEPTLTKLKNKACCMSNLTTTFAALGDDTRFAIVERLLKEGELSAGDLQEGTSISAPAVSRHLKVLRSAGLVNQRVDKQRRLYSARPEAVQSIGAWSMSYRDFWQNSLDRLEWALVQESKK